MEGYSSKFRPVRLAKNIINSLESGNLNAKQRKKLELSKNAKQNRGKAVFFHLNIRIRYIPIVNTNMMEVVNVQPKKLKNHI